jgi:acyl dehydratase
MSVDYAQLAPGQEISSRTVVLDAVAVSRYVEAVEDRSAGLTSELGGDPTPPMAIAALTLRGVLTDLAIPGGTVHAGQELEFKGAVRVGERLACRATLAQNSVRGDWRFMVVRVQAEDSTGRIVMEGKSTIMVPV